MMDLDLANIYTQLQEVVYAIVDQAYPTEVSSSYH